MGRISDEKLLQLTSILSKMSLKELRNAITTEFGVPWQEVRKAVMSARLPMSSNSVTNVMKRYTANNIDDNEIDNILAMLKLYKIAVSMTKQWHTIILSERIFPEEPVSNMIRLLETRVHHAARRVAHIPGGRPEVYTKKFGDLIFLSLQMIAPRKSSSPLYAALVPNEPVAFLSSIGNKKLVQAIIEGIGYKVYTDPHLYGPDIMSLLRIVDRSISCGADEPMPAYRPACVPSRHGVDFTMKQYNENYVDEVLGANPPILNCIEVSSTFESDVLKRSIKISATLKADDVANTLKEFVANRCLNPESELLNVFRVMKSNKFELNGDSNDASVPD